MPRNMDPSLLAALSSPFVAPFFAVTVTFISQTFNLWSGPGELVWNGVTYQGTPDLGKIGSIAESSDLKAVGTSISLSGINQAILQECLDDVQLGAPCQISLGALNIATMQPIGTPYTLFSGLVDQPQVSYSPTGCTITLAIESHLLRLGVGSQRHFTSADQRLASRFPTDTLFDRVELENDKALLWGT